MAAIAFVAAGAGILVRQAWWRPLVLIAAAFSSVIYLFWDGILRHLDDKGATGILINLAILAALIIFHWPNLEF